MPLFARAFALALATLALRPFPLALAFSIGALSALSAAEPKPSLTLGYWSIIGQSHPPQWGGNHLHADFQAPPGWVIDADAFPDRWARGPRAPGDSVLVLMGARIESDSLAFGPWLVKSNCIDFAAPDGERKGCLSLKARAWFRTGFDFAMGHGRDGGDSSAYPRLRVRVAYMACTPAGCGAARTVVAEAYGGRPPASRNEEASTEDLRGAPPIREAKAEYARVRDSLSGVVLDSLRMVLTVRMNPGWRIVADALGDTVLLPVRFGAGAPGYGFHALPARGTARIPAPAGQGEIVVHDSVFRVEFVPDLPQEEMKYLGRSPESRYPDTWIRFRYQACNGPECLPPKEATFSYRGYTTGLSHFASEERFDPIQVAPMRRRGESRGAAIGRGAMRRGELAP